MRIAISLVFSYCFILSQAQNLVTVNDVQFQRNRILSLEDTTKTTFYYTSSWEEDGLGAQSAAIGDNLYLHPVKVVGTFNSQYARSFNDGPVWSGKGLSSTINVGASYKSKSLEVTLSPTFSYAQNGNYDTQPAVFDDQNEFSYPWFTGIDFPQRFGDESTTWIFPGQSRIKYTWKEKLYVKFSSENMWWGPSYFNSILMTNTAPGFPHLSFGSDKLLNTKIGSFGFNLYWGRLQKSEFYDGNQVDSQFFNGSNIEYQPSFIDGLTLGFGRILYRSWDRKSKIRDYLLFLGQFSVEADSTVRSGNDEYDQLASLYLKWKFPSVGFEAYFEYARNDFGGDLQNLVISQPDHSRFYTFGFAKLITSPQSKTRLIAEFSTLSRSNTRLIGASPVLYVHNIGGGGYTHNGQLIGAPIGPGSNSQVIGFDVIKESFDYGAKIQRISINDDYFFANAGRDSQLARDVETSLDCMFNWYKQNTTIGLRGILSVRNNWYYTRPGNTSNVFLGISLSQGL